MKNKFVITYNPYTCKFAAWFGTLNKDTNFLNAKLLAIGLNVKPTARQLRKMLKDRKLNRKIIIK